MRTIRRKLTYANVMSTIAVFLLLGGATALAATKLAKNSVGSNQIKKNAITTAKIKNNAVTEAKINSNAISGAKIANAAVTGVKVANGSLTGANINLSTLGTVPSATTANSASSANSVNGQTPSKIFKILTPGQSNVQVTAVSGFTITATCEAENVNVTLTSPSSAGSVLSSEGRGEEAHGAVNSIFSYQSAKAGKAASIRLDEEGGKENSYGESTFSGALSTGTVISGQLGYDYQTFNMEAPERCVVFGEVTTG